jgi:methionine-rich copper-binding protein CopC
MRQLFLAFLLALAAVLINAGPARAHSYIVDSTPTAGEIVTVLPERFEVVANEPLLDLGGNGSGFGIEIRDSAGLYYGDGCVTVDGAALSTRAAIGEPGSYRMTYQLVSADGHTVSGELAFEWRPEAEFAASAGSATAGDCDGQYARGDGASEGGAESTDLTTVLWIGGTLLAIAAAVGITLLVLRRRA